MPVKPLGVVGPPGPPGNDGAGVPPGGVVGQVLTKTSDLDNATGWQTPAPAGVTSVNSQTGAVTLTKADIGLGSVDNTSDTDKPVSTATQTALNAKADTSALTAHTGNTSNPHAVTKAQVGLGSVPNVDATNRANHTGTQSADTLTDGTTNKAFLATERTKLAGIAAGAEVNVNADWNASSGDALILNKPTIPPAFVSPLTAKGQLYGRTSSADAAVPAGADGQALVADSSQPAGVGWGYRRTPVRRVVATSFYTVRNTLPQNSSGWFVTALNTIHFCPLEIPEAMTIVQTRIGIRTATAGGSVRLGFFRLSGTTATLIADFGVVASTTTGPKTLTGLNVPVASGLYYYGVLTDGATELLGYNAYVIDSEYNGSGGGTTLTKAATYGAFAASYTGLALATVGGPDAPVWHAGVA